jgi:zinc-ribbon domain
MPRRRRKRKRRRRSTPAPSCTNCGARLPKDSRFCPECGVRVTSGDDATAVEDVPLEETGSVPVHTVAAEPHYFGVAPPLALFALAVGALVLAVVLLVTGKTIIGALLLVAAGIFLALFVAASRRLPDNAVARVSRNASRTLRDRTGFAVEAVSAHSSTRREVFRLRHEIAELVASRAEAARTLGEAVYGGADDEAETARNRMGELDRAIAEKEGEMTRVTAVANERIQQAHLQVQATAIVEPPNVPEPMPAPSEPSQPVTVPEPSPVPSEPPTPVPSPDPLPDPSPPEPEQPS